MIFIVIAVILICLFGFITLFFYRIGKPINESVSKSYYYHAWKNKMVHAPMGNWFELGYTEFNADAKSLVVLSEDFAKDNTTVFWKGVPQLVDHVSFKVDEFRIPKDDKHVYKTNVFDTLQIVVDADPASYRPMGEKEDSYITSWFKDDRSYFFQGHKIDVDYATFEKINKSLMMDAWSVYSLVKRESSAGYNETMQVVKMMERPAGTVKSINDSYAQIGTTIFLSNWKNEFASIVFEKIDSIQIIDERNIAVNNHLIADGTLLKGIDISTLTIIDRDYLKDQSAVYYESKKIELADSKSFEVVFEEYSKDKQHAFYKWTVLTGANPANVKYDYASATITDGKNFYKDGVLVKK